MSVTNYTDLKTNIANWLARSDLTDVIPDLITLAEQRIHRGCDAFMSGGRVLPQMNGLRIKAMETSLNETISSGVIAVPTGYLSLKHAYIESDPVRALERKSSEWIYENYPTRSAVDKPHYIAREGNNFIFAAYPDSDYTVKGIYYKEFDALSDSNLTNWLTDNAYGLLLFGALCEAAVYVDDDRKLFNYELKYREKLNSIQQDNDDEEFSGSTLSTKCG